MKIYYGTSMCYPKEYKTFGIACPCGSLWIPDAEVKYKNDRHLCTITVNKCPLCRESHILHTVTTGARIGIYDSHVDEVETDVNIKYFKSGGSW